MKFNYSLYFKYDLLKLNGNLQIYKLTNKNQLYSNFLYTNEVYSKKY
jgi:hypothetical protein